MRTRRGWCTAVVLCALASGRPAAAGEAGEGAAPGGAGRTAQEQGERRGAAGAGAAMETLAQQARAVVADIGGARRDLAEGDHAAADGKLQDARRMLGKMFEGAPAGRLAAGMSALEGKLRQGEKGIDFAPLDAEVREVSLYLDPQVVAGVEQAKRESKEDPRKAADTLRLARDRLVLDVAMLPVEAAYARVVAAKALLAEGNVAHARRLLDVVPVTLAEVELTAPIAAARFDLRVAAAAAAAKDWKRAERLVDRAAESLRAASRGAEGELAKELEPVSRRATELEERIDGATPVEPKEIRELAQRTTSIEAG